MNIKFVLILALVISVSGCAKMRSWCGHGDQGKSSGKMVKGKLVLEIEDFDLKNMDVKKDAKAGGGKVAVMKDSQSKAEMTIQLPKGKYEVKAYARGIAKESDAFYMTLGSMTEQKLVASQKKGIEAIDAGKFEQKADGTVTIKIRFREPKIELDRLEFKQTK